MKEVINIYKKHKHTIEDYIGTFMKNQPDDPIQQSQAVLTDNHFIQLMYAVDDEFKQITPIVCRKESDTSRVYSDKAHYFRKVVLDDTGIYISNPYIHYRTGKASISAIRYRDEKYYVYDIDLIRLLEELRLIEYNSFYDNLSRTIYGFGAILLAFVSVFLIGYGGYKLFVIMFGTGDIDFFSKIFKSIISITLGLAIYDLAKQILEHEVIFHSFHHEEGKQYKVLGKFLISIIIALSIESMMVVFKIALSDYTQMLSAFYLLLGTTIVLVALTHFYKVVNRVPEHKE